MVVVIIIVIGVAIEIPAKRFVRLLLQSQCLN